MYTPSLQITASTLISKRRALPLNGRVLVKVGDSVNADTAVLSTELPGELHVVRLADRLSVEPESITSRLKLKVGDIVTKGSIICELKSFFGLFHSTITSPIDGTVEFYNEQNAHIGIREKPTLLSIPAYISGTVSEVEKDKAVTIETHGALIQGIFGLGGERSGQITLLDVSSDEVVTPQHLHHLELQNAILIGGKSFSVEALNFCAEAHVSGVLTASITSQALKEFAGNQVNISVTGEENIPFTFIISEGFGELSLSEKVKHIAKVFNGKFASICGATQVRAGAMRPEIIIPSEDFTWTEEDVQNKQLLDKTKRLKAASTTEDNRQSELTIGTTVRCIRVPFFGQFGSIIELPNAPATIPSGAIVRVCKVRLTDNREVMVPRANIEIV